MKILPGLLLRLALGTAVFLGGLVFQQWVATSVLAGLMLLSFLPWKAQIDRIGQIMVLLSCLVLAWVLANVIGPRPDHPVFPAFALVRAVTTVFALLYGIAQLFFSNPLQGPLGSLAAGLVAVLALGGNQVGLLYPLFSGSYVVVGLLTIAIADDGRAPLLAADGRTRFWSLSVFASAVAVAIAICLALPSIHKWVSDRIQISFVEQKTGFSPIFELGSLAEIATNDAVVLRVFGPKPDYLRGIVYTEYYKGKWIVGQGHIALPKRVQHFDREQANRVRIRKVSGDYDFYFLPLGTRKIEVALGEIQLNAFGIASAKSDEEAGFVQFEKGPRDHLEVLPPTESDLALPEELADKFRGVAESWVGDAADRKTKLIRIAEKLSSQYVYSLKSQRTKGEDPTWDFLTINKTGHCEYFASAMALLARSLEIPTRVLAGYRVNERNRFGDYHVVRERDAHSWVEAWLPEVGWRTYDPTPGLTGSGLAERRSGVLAGLTDYLSANLSRVGERLEQITFLQMSIGVVVLVLFWIGLRIVRKLRSKHSAGLSREIAYSDPLPEILLLFEKLDQLGESIGKSEPVEQFASRVGESQTIGRKGSEVEQLLLRYSAFRYGKIGRESELATDISRWIDSV